jgi:tripartite-type tricarboxylate transporter receptor subunit TctC
MIVPYTAGSATDVEARVLAEWMGRSLGQPTVIENVTGADSARGQAQKLTARVLA